ncbi:unnamed protein product [Schistocephalus solidus]|uniref:TAXi_C domain-containing protein n=1 Tax=Schistocephalus solidus TaxID=70667 RepID=A0A183TU04_SCHSO|nr:unnamed protein product [Schistocephalus solidus]
MSPVGRHIVVSRIGVVNKPSGPHVYLLLNKFYVTDFTQVVNAPVAASNWFLTLTGGSSKLGSSQRPHPGQQRAKPGDGLRCCVCLHTRYPKSSQQLPLIGASTVSFVVTVVSFWENCYKPA